MHSSAIPFLCSTDEEFMSMENAKVVFRTDDDYYNSEPDTDNLTLERTKLRRKQELIAQRILKDSPYLSRDADTKELVEYAFSDTPVTENEGALATANKVKNQVTLFVEGMKIHHMKQLVALADRLTLIQDVLTSRTKDVPTEDLISLHKEYRQLFESLYEHFTKENKDMSSLNTLIQNNTQVNVGNPSSTTELNHPGLQHIVSDESTRRIALQRVNSLLSFIMKQPPPEKNDN